MSICGWYLEQLVSGLDQRRAVTSNDADTRAESMPEHGQAVLGNHGCQSTGVRATRRVGERLRDYRT